MIPRRELDELSGEWSLEIGVIEKDYVLGWLLAGIAQHPELKTTWIFKGGTCLRKCYYETFRFSEDLDFTVIDGGTEEPDDLRRIFAEVGEWLREESGNRTHPRREVISAPTQSARPSHHPRSDRLPRSQPDPRPAAKGQVRPNLRRSPDPKPDVATDRAPLQRPAPSGAWRGLLSDHRTVR